MPCPELARTADNDELHPSDPPELFLDRHQIEKGLSGMFMGPIPGIDHRGLEVFRQKMGGPGRRVTDHEDIGFHGLKIFGRIDQGLPFDEAARR